MLDVPSLRRSIGLTQAVAVLFASLVVGLLLSAGQVVYSLDRHHHDALAHCEQILTLAEGGATSAAWTLDSRLAQRVVDAVGKARAVTGATLSDEKGDLLASAANEATPAKPLARWFAARFLGEPLTASRNLSVRIDSGTRPVGRLAVELSREEVAGEVLRHAGDHLVVTVLTALSVGLLLLVLSSRLVTSPLRRVAEQMSSLDPERPHDLVLEVSPGHHEDELGELVRHANGMLARLADTQDELRRLATRDALTGLANRDLIADRLRQSISSARRRGLCLAVMFLDLDRFKTINDSLGHEAGDRLLVSVARILSDNVRADDSIGRLGGDEFVLLLEDLVDPDEASHTAERLVRSLARPIGVGEREVRVAASVGVAVFPDDGEDAATLMRHADLAMYRAKQAGGNRWQYFAREMSERMDIRLRMELALADALDAGELSLHYQPKATAGRHRLTGCEALVRWRHDGKLLEARDFIHVAEDTGLVLAIGNWVLDTACAQIASWSARGYRVPVAVNVSARQLAEKSFVETVLETVARHDIDATLLSLEITETLLMVDQRRSAEDLARLSEHGIAVSIDDFGTGYASLAYLARLPARSLKIDRSFVAAGRESRPILETIVAMAKALGLATVGEGVETERDAALLLSVGCDEIQGHYIGAPASCEDFERDHLPAFRTSQVVQIRS